MQQARVPCERNRDRPPVSKIDVQRILSDPRGLGEGIWMSIAGILIPSLHCFEDEPGRARTWRCSLHAPRGYARAHLDHWRRRKTYTLRHAKQWAFGLSSGRHAPNEQDQPRAQRVGCMLPLVESESTKTLLASEKRGLSPITSYEQGCSY